MKKLKADWSPGGSGKRNSVVPVSPSRSIPHLPITPARKTKFLAELAKTGSFTAAARHTDGSEGTRRSYKILQAKDISFSRDCDEALATYSSAVQALVHSLVFDGVKTPVTNKDGVVKDKDGKEIWITNRDARIVLNYLKKWNPSYTDAKNLNINVDGQPSDPNDPEIRIRASDLWTLPAYEAEQLLGLLRKVHSNRSETLVDISPRPEYLEGEAGEIPAEEILAEESNPYDI